MTGLIKKHMPDAYKRVARSVGYSLLLSDENSWRGLAVILAAQITPEERAALSWASLRSLDAPEQVEMVAEAVLPHAGYPLQTFLNPMSDARWWASCASRSEIKAYAIAAHDAMNFADQMAFRNHISEVEIAA